MNESVGYTVTINIIITFIVIVFVFLANVLIYYKSNKVGNLITDSIEKYSGFNSYAKAEIEQKLVSIGYNKTSINCGETVKEKGEEVCHVVDPDSTKQSGYCVYLCDSSDSYYYYKIKTNMIINIPIINNFVHGTVFSSTVNLYNFTDTTVTISNSGVSSENNFLRGDVNFDGKIDYDDLRIVRNYISGRGTLTPEQIDAGDLNDDGFVDILDVSYYQMKNLFPGAKPGDANLDGKIDCEDAILILKYAVDKVQLDSIQFEASNVNNDAVVDVTDASAIQRLIYAETGISCS